MNDRAPLAVNVLAPAELMPDNEVPKAQRGVSATRRTVQRFLRNPVALVALAFLSIVVFVALFAPWIAPHDPTAQSIVDMDQAPSGEHWLGTDDLGRDELSRLMYATRLSMSAGLQAIFLAACVAIPLGLISGFFRGAVDGTIMRIADGIGSFPPILLALSIAAILGPGGTNLAIAVAVVFVPGMMRITRGQVLAVREETYIEASRSIGSRNWRIIASHVVPNIAPVVIVQVAVSFGFALVTESGLSFLGGLGEPPPAASWGRMLEQGYNSWVQGYSFFLVLWPALAITLTVVAFQLVGDGVRDAMGRDIRTVSGRKLRRLERADRLRAPAAPEGPRGGAALDVRNLSVEFLTPRGWVRVINDVSFSVAAGRTLGLVGESGSGKTVSVLAAMGLLPPGQARITSGSVRLDERELVGLPLRELRSVRGRDIAMVFQEPMTSLNPAFSVGNQLVETVRRHRRVSRAEARARAIEVLDLVGIPNAAARLRDYPHQFSGGMRQRVMIAMALACDPKLLIADEPTTALDVTIQAQILELFKRLQAELGMAIIFVTHDLGVVADICDEVAVLYAGQVVEQADVQSLFQRPHHPYTQGLLDSMPQATAVGQRLRVIPGQVPRPEAMPAGCRFHPRCAHAVPECAEVAVELVAIAPNGHAGGAVRCRRADELVLVGSNLAGRAAAAAPEVGSEAGPAAASAESLVRVESLAVRFPIRSKVLRRTIGHVHAVDGVDLEIRAGETLGLVGESGSGKSTTGRGLLKLVAPSAGSVTVAGVDITAARGRELRVARADMQMVFQDPYSSLDPRRTISETVGEPLAVHRGLRGKARDDEVARLLDLVGLGRHALQRYPYEFSGGQRQRIAIARALAPQPDLVVCDEPVSSLDVSTQSQVINLLADLQRELGVAYLFIAHDLSVVSHISHRIAVMYLGRIVESGPSAEVIHAPRHPYTQALLSAVPVPDPTVQRTRRRIVLAGDQPSPANPPSGCHFHTRCPYAMDVCRSVDPPAFRVGDVGEVFCHLHTEGPHLDGRPVTELVPTEIPIDDAPAPVSQGGDE